MPVSNYMNKESLQNTLNNIGVTAQMSQINTDLGEDYYLVNSMMAKKMSGVEAIPYQFMSTVDRRISNSIPMGRKFTDKIISRMPLLFLTPCKQVFMPDASDSDKNIISSMLTGGSDSSASQLLENNGRYYTVEFDYQEYYKYLNCMLSAVAAFMGIYDEIVSINGKRCKLGQYAWQNELSDEFKTFFSAEENLIFYMDNMTSVSENFTNETTESSLASTINGYADQANEIRFLFGDKGGALGNIIDGVSEVTSSITSSLSEALGNIGGGIIESLADKGVNTVLNGGKIVFPQIWSNSTYTRSYPVEIKLRSPDNDSLSIFLNIIKPYCRLLALTLPRLMTDSSGNINPNGYRSPFLVKAYSKGLFNVDMGIISSMSVTKGAECCWNDDGLPTQIDISLEIQDLYSSLAMSGFGTTDRKGLFNIDGLSSVVNNTAYMDYLANMSGLNIGQMEFFKKGKLYYYLTQTDVTQIGSRIYSKFDQTLSKIGGKIYNII